jgi:hypothetical protein
LDSLRASTAYQHTRPTNQCLSSSRPPKTTLEKEHILLLGATGATGLVFLNTIQTLPRQSRPKVTAYVRSRSKLPPNIQTDLSILIVEGALNDAYVIESAMQGVTTVISFVGVYISLSHAVLRTKPTPIASAFPVIFSAMRTNGVSRILVLSTPSTFPQTVETLSWKWAFYNAMPPLLVPQGNAEMKGIAEKVSAQSQQD